MADLKCSRCGKVVTAGSNFLAGDIVQVNMGADIRFTEQFVQKQLGKYARGFKNRQFAMGFCLECKIDSLMGVPVVIDKETGKRVSEEELKKIMEKKKKEFEEKQQEKKTEDKPNEEDPGKSGIITEGL